MPVTDAITADIRGYLEDYLRQKSINPRKCFRCLSPIHEDKHPSMSYNDKVENVHCFACGVTYDLFDLVGMDYGINTFFDKQRKAAELFGIHISDDRPTQQNKKKSKSVSSEQHNELKDRTPELLKLRQGYDRSLGYFESRGIDAFACEKNMFFERDGRAYMPVFRGEICTGWCTRAIDDDVIPRYKNTSGAMDIWNGDALISGEGDIFVTEGIIDAVCIEQLGKTAVALCGAQNGNKLAGICEMHLQKLSARRFILCGDPDEAGRKMNESLKEKLSRFGLSCEILPLKNADINELYLKDKANLVSMIENQELQRDKDYAQTSAAAMLEDFFSEAQRRSMQPNITTGFRALDKLLDGGLHAGLYCIGAISSLGKTSFVLQMADAISTSGRDVLFFSLEQSRFELMAKSLSRISTELYNSSKQGFTVRQLMNGTVNNLFSNELMQEVKDSYESASRSLFIREGIADIGTSEIREAVRAHVSARGKPPVVIVDYLQILKPSDNRATDKQNTDRAVVELKRISRDFDIPVIAVSSFNRENYRAAVSMEAFKESGAVEYSSDVLLGLQLKGAGSREFDVNAVKSKEIRDVELVLLKNRSGIPWGKIDFGYNAKFNLFCEK